jgi:esterase/lipase
MPRKSLLYLVLAAFSVEAVGCSTTKPFFRGQSPENSTVADRWRRTVRSGMERTWDVTKKGLALGGALALWLGASYLQSEIDDIGAPSTRGNDSHHTARESAAPPRSQGNHQDQDHKSRRADEPASDRKD